MQESSRLNITPFIQVNYDAQACYDRIIPKVAFQLSYKYGVNKKIKELVQKVMSQTKYFIKIGNTITDQFYNNILEYKLFGTGQGSGFSPHIWTLLSSELFQIYSEYSSGFEFNPPYSTSSSQIHITAYVDNVNMHHTFPSKSTISTMIQKTSISAQQWHELLHISGGQLSCTKCNFYAVTWEFASTSLSKVNAQLHPTMLIKDSSDQPFLIQNKKTDDSHKSLGYRQSMASTKLYQKRKIE
jgi:Reverse transcriptase (RNA-dependent DNA polymerase)